MALHAGELQPLSIFELLEQIVSEVSLKLYELCRNVAGYVVSFPFGPYCVFII